MRFRGSMKRLRSANPFPEDPPPTKSSPDALRRTGQALLVLVGVLVIGAGAAWAAGGIDPVSSIFGDDVEVIDSDHGLEQFSVLEPATQEKFDDLPRDLAFRVFAIAVRNTIVVNTRNGDEPFDENGRSRSKDFDPIPAEISAIGRGETSSGTGVTVMVIEGDFCFYLSLRGPSNCASLEEIQDTALVGAEGEPGNRKLSRMYGLVTDDVASIEIEGSGLPPTPVSDNAFDIRNVKPNGEMRLVGLDANGAELFACTGGRLGGAARWTRCT